MTQPPDPSRSAGPIAQLRAGRLARRLSQLVVGQALLGATFGLLFVAGLGLNPWDVLHDGLTHYVPLSFGQVMNVVGALLLLLWIPLRVSPGIGTVTGVVIVGVAADAVIAVVPVPGQLAWQIALMVIGVVGNALACALYVGTDLGPGARDGLWLGIARRTGWSVRLVRGGLEGTVLLLGWVIGGAVGFGTVAYFVLIGPLVQYFLRHVAVDRPGGPGARRGGRFGFCGGTGSGWLG